MEAVAEEAAAKPSPRGKGASQMSSPLNLSDVVDGVLEDVAQARTRYFAEDKDILVVLRKDIMQLIVDHALAWGMLPPEGKTTFCHYPVISTDDIEQPFLVTLKCNHKENPA